MPGWWWLHYDAIEREQVQAFAKQHRVQMLIGKTFTEPKTGGEIIVFQVAVAPLIWTLPRWPTQAPKGLATEPSDIAKSAGTPTPQLRGMLEELLGKPWDKIKATADSANDALKVLIWGGAAVLLWNLFQHTRADDEVET